MEEFWFSGEELLKLGQFSKGLSEEEIGRLVPPEPAPTPTSASQPKPTQSGPDGTTGRLKPVDRAEGDHSTYKRGPDGQVTKTASYKQNPQNPSGFDETQRTDTAGKSHYNKATKQDVRKRPAAAS